MSSLRDRARQASREERTRASHAGPTDAQIAAAGALSEILDCEIDPLTLVGNVAGGLGLQFAAVVDDLRIRVLLGADHDLIDCEVEIGRGALRSWRTFADLSSLGALLD